LLNRPMTSTLLDALERVCDTLVERECCKNKGDFAANWLKVSRLYLIKMREKGLVPFEKAARLHFTLLQRHHPDLAGFIYDELRAEAQR
jgi:hypothetical protein